MNVSEIIKSSVTTHTNIPKTQQAETQKKTTTLATDNTDKFDADTAFYSKNYNNAANKTEYLNVQGYKGSTLQVKNALMQEYVNFNIGNQSGGIFGKITDNPFFGYKSFNPAYNPLPFALNAYNAAEATSDKFEDYWGADAVSERIFTFAKTLAGDNEDLFNTMKNAFLKGFNLASGARGNKLPDISYETKNKTLEKFDAWEKEIAAKKAAQNTKPEETSSEKK